jgi:glycine/D-amino acid oxidase-like deaminating enzyme
VLARFGVAHRILDGEGVLAVEPALRTAAVRPAGGLHLPDDETGDCHKFTRALAELLRRSGVAFKFNTTVNRLLLDGSRIAGVMTDRGAVDAGAYVVALGSEAARILRPLGIDLPIYPVKGYSVTVDIDAGVPAPRSSVMDEHYKVMITRLGTRFRAAGIAEVAGFDASIRRAVWRPCCAASGALPQRRSLAAHARRAHGRLRPIRRTAAYLGRRASPTCSSMSATDRTAGRKPADADGWWPTSCPAPAEIDLEGSASIGSDGSERHHRPRSLRRLRDQLRAALLP